jgi:WD40 repeat protein
VDIKGREIALSGKFDSLGPGEAERRLEAAGVRVTDELTPSTVAVFIGKETSRDKGNEAYVQGIPRYDEAALLAALAAVEVTANGEEASPASAPGVFVDPAALAAADPAELEDLLTNADWTSFVPARDLPPLRDRLTALERDLGVTPARRLATTRVRVRGTTLSRPYGHRSKISALALSSSGSHLATGDWGDGESGTVQVWEVTTGRCVNVLRWIDGGVGWEGYARAVQWSADGLHLGMAFRTNAVGVWDPFGESCEPRAEAQVTNGDSRPPAWALHPDGRSAYVSTATPDGQGVQGCVPPLCRGVLHWLAEYAAVPHEHILAKGPLPAAIQELCGEELLVDQPPVWSSDGNLLYVANRFEAFVVDVRTGDPLWLTKVEWLAEWSPDGRYLAHVHDGLLHFRDAATGRPTCEPLPADGDRWDLSLHWGLRGSTARLAVVLSGERSTDPGVAIFDDGRVGHRLAVIPAKKPEGDFATWAWAPSGDRGAVLTAAGNIEVWSLGDGEPRLLRTLGAPAGAKGVLWGADDIVVAVGEKVLRFLRAGTGETVGDYTFLRDADAELPLHPDFVYDHFDGRIVALDGQTWCLPVEPDMAIAPPERRADVEAHLAWIVDRRFAWPLHWGRFDIHRDAETAAAHLPTTSPDFRALRVATSSEGH